MHNRRNCVPGNLTSSPEGEPDSKKRKLDDDVIVTNIAFFRAHYTDVELPKSRLYIHAVKNSLELPVYETLQEEKLFRSVLTFCGKRYASSYWEKNKKFAEQGSALVCSLHMGLVEEEVLIKNGSILK